MRERRSRSPPPVIVATVVRPRLVFGGGGERNQKDNEGEREEKGSKHSPFIVAGVAGC